MYMYICMCTYIHICMYCMLFTMAPPRENQMSMEGSRKRCIFVLGIPNSWPRGRRLLGAPCPRGRSALAALLRSARSRPRHLPRHRGPDLRPSSSPSRAPTPTGAVLRNLSTPSFILGSATRCIAMLCNERVGFECRGRASLRCISLRCNALRMRAIIVATARSVCCEARTASDVAARAPARPSAAPRVMSAPPVAILARGQRALPQGDLRAREGNFAAATAQGSGPGGGRRR